MKKKKKKKQQKSCFTLNESCNEFLLCMSEASSL